jgi:hypothetical protein
MLKGGNKMSSAYGVGIRGSYRNFVTVQQDVIRKETFKLKPSISNKIIILKDATRVSTYQVGELSF